MAKKNYNYQEKKSKTAEESESGSLKDETKALSSDGGDSTGSSSVLKTTPTSNPLNPRTNKNLLQPASIAAKIGYVPPSSSISGKRWISIQAYSHAALDDYNNYTMTESGLVISVTKRPWNNSGWDEVVEVTDITPYDPAEWSYNVSPNAASNLTINTSSDHIELVYSNQAFHPAVGYYNSPAVNGLFELDLKVTFASGHVEYFTNQGFSQDNGPIACPVGANYINQLHYQSGGSSATKQQEVWSCENKRNTPKWWYSKGANYLISPNKVSDYSILTRYKPVHNPAGSLEEWGLYKEFLTDNLNLPYLELVNPMDAWQDPLAHEYANFSAVNPDPLTTAKQVFKRIDVMFQHNNIDNLEKINSKDQTWFQNNYSSVGGNVWVDDSQAGSDPTSYDSVYANMQVQNSQQYLFTSTYYYSENIPNCQPTDPRTEYTVCDTVGNPSYFQTTSQDCSGTTIPAADLPGGTNYSNVTFIHDQACCTACTLSLSVQAIDASYNVNNGYIYWNTLDSGVASGDTWGSGSMYTVSITNASNTVVGTAAPTGGNTFTDATCDTVNNSSTVTCNSSTAIVPGMQVSASNISTTTGNGIVYVANIMSGVASTNVTSFLLEDSLGAPVNASSTLTDTTLTFSTGYTGIHGALAPNDASNPYYTICVTDESGCKECSNFVINAAQPPTGCTDNTAVNYDATAVNDDGSCI